MTCTYLIMSLKENIGKDFFRIGNEVDFRGNKSLYALLLPSAVCLHSDINPIYQPMETLGMYRREDGYVTENVVWRTF